MGPLDWLVDHFGNPWEHRVLKWIPLALSALAILISAIAIGFADQMQAVAKQLNNSIPASFDSPTIAATNAASGAVNGMAALLGARGVGTSTFNIVLPDGTPLASFIFDPLRGIIQQKGVALA